jgi:hypothetical protein
MEEFDIMVIYLEDTADYDDIVHLLVEHGNVPFRTGIAAPIRIEGAAFVLLAFAERDIVALLIVFRDRSLDDPVVLEIFEACDGLPCLHDENIGILTIKRVHTVCLKNC